MSSKPIVQQFYDDVEKVIDKYRDQGITISEIVGSLELSKLDLYKEVNNSEEEDF